MATVRPTVGGGENSLEHPPASATRSRGTLRPTHGRFHTRDAGSKAVLRTKRFSVVKKVRSPFVYGTVEIEYDATDVLAVAEDDVRAVV